MAIDSPDIAVEKRLLVKAEKLHKFALNLARQVTDLEIKKL